MNKGSKFKHSEAQFAVPVVIGVALLIGIFYFLSLVPAVQGLESGSKLPMFHGASTWANLMIIVLLGVFSVLALVTKSDRMYRWEVGMRVVGLGLWVVNSALGYIAALSAWDFSGYNGSKLGLVMEDPRLRAQVYLVIGAAVLVLTLWLILEKRMHKSLADLVYVAITAFLMIDLFVDPLKRALHPDSPVLNSDELMIKLPFFAMVACMFAFDLLVAWSVRSHVKAPVDPVPGSDPVLPGDLTVG